MNDWRAKLAPTASGRRGDSILLSFPSSNANVRADLRALQTAGMLSLFCTTIAWRHGRSLMEHLPSGLGAELRRRAFDGIDPNLIRTFPRVEVVRQVADRLGLTSLTCAESSWASMDGVSRDFDRRVAELIARGRVQATGVYAYDYAALRTFEAAAAAGMRRFYELPTGYWRATLRLLQEEADRNPEWTATMTALRDSGEKHERKDAELRAADHVFVPSSFVRSTLKEHPSFPATIDVIPYGAPQPRERRAVPQPRGKLRVLYAGNLTQQKGISYLFAAMRQVAAAASLTLIGGRSGSPCAALDAALRSHDWQGSLPHERALELMAQHDLLILPSIAEGFGLVILEAMASGLPVIATPNTGGPDVIEEGVDGFLVPIRDPDAIARRVLDLHADRDRLESMSRAALRKAAALSWDARAGTLIGMIRRLLGVVEPDHAG
jgi:glycosyltransferase involved in cell wall biosynthesis